MTRRAAIAALVAFAAFSQARGEWVTEVVTNRVEYDGVEWLKGNGSSYINTRQAPTANIRCTATISAPAPSSQPSAWRGILGSSIAHNDSAYRSFDIYFGSSGSYYIGCTICGQFTDTIYTYTANTKIKIDATPQRVSVGSGVFTSSRTIGSYTNPIYIFSANRLNPSVVTFYDFTLSKGGVKLIDFVPVLHNGAGKMLNLVDGQLYANAGTGAFTYGAVTGKVAYVTITTNRVYRAPAPMRSFDAQHPFNNAAARTRLGGTGNGEDGTTLRPTAHFDIKRNEED